MYTYIYQSQKQKHINILLRAPSGWEEDENDRADYSYRIQLFSMWNAQDSISGRVLNFLGLQVINLNAVDKSTYISLRGQLPSIVIHLDLNSNQH